jgi:hypothetical protein
MLAAVLLEGLARPLLLAHAVLGFTAVGAATHLAVYALLAVRGRSLKGLQRFAWIAPASVIPQFGLGLLLYPAYRIHVRAADFDKNAPHLTQLFDFKEHLAAVGLALVVGGALLARGVARQEPAGAPSGLRGAIAALAVSGASLIWIVALVGLYVTARHPVGPP